MWCQMKRIAVFNVKNQDTSLNIVLKLDAMNVQWIQSYSSWTVHTKCLLPAHQWHITRHTKVTMPDQAPDTTRKDWERWSQSRSQSYYWRHCSSQSLAICTKATLDHNTWHRCSHHRSQLMIISLCPQRTQSQTSLWHTAPVSRSSTHHSSWGWWSHSIVVGHTHDHPTDLQGINHASWRIVVISGTVHWL